MNILAQAKLALTKIKLEAVSLADAQVIALEALNALNELSKQSEIVLPEEKEDLLTGPILSVNVAQAAMNLGWNWCLADTKRLNNL
jgi:hypothetical protein